MGFYTEEFVLRNSVKGNCCLCVTVVSVFFLLCAFVFPVPVYAIGEIAAWGYNNEGECNVPEPNTGFTAVSGGAFHSLGLRADSSIAAWGDNLFNQCVLPSPNTDFNSISAGGFHSLALKSNGSIVAWGSDNYGVCDVPEPNTGFTAVAAGFYHSLGLKADTAGGSIVAWGDTTFGQGTLPSPNTGFTAIAAGGFHSLGLKIGGSIVAWGRNSDHQCVVPEPNTGFKTIAAGGSHSLGLKIDGSIIAWGDNSFGQCNVPEPNKGFIAIAAGGDHSLGLKIDGSIIAWGDNTDLEGIVPSPNESFTAIAAGAFHSLGLKGCIYNLVGDISNDCTVNLDDMIILARQWLQPPDTPSADIAPPPNGNGITDFLDFATLANNWIVDCIDNPSNPACIPKVCPFNVAGDLNKDCEVNLEDITILAAQWLTSPGIPSADIAPPPGGDGIIDFLDFATLANNWLVDCFHDSSSSACVNK
jgi:alpha-tubulin suppressor-like RCC1 family protein